MQTEGHLFSVPNDCLWYDKLWGPSQRVVTLFIGFDYNVHQRLQPTAKDVLHQDDGHLAHFQPDPALHRGPSSYLQGELHTKGLVPFTQLVKVRRESLFWYFRASNFH